MLDKQSYKEYKQLAKENHVLIFQEIYKVPGFNYRFKHSGVTVAVMPTMPEGQSGTMLYISLSYCNVKDKFSKKIGEYNALRKLFNSEYIQLPIGGLYKDREKLEKYVLQLAFSAVYAGQ